MKFIRLIAVVWFSSVVAAQTEEPARPAEGISDNSFLVEEAYNQEAGVVQHIFTALWSYDRQPGSDERGWDFSYTPEVPLFSQRHQLSFTLPYSFPSGHSENDWGDILLNYRLQALFEGDSLPAFSPRFSLILPTSSGSDELGYQINLPVSKILADRWTAHFNAGATLLPDTNGRDLVGYNLGASIIYAATPTFNLMLELVGNWDEETTATGGIDRNFAAVISPGVRYAFNRANGAQYVVGLGFPVGLTRDTPDFGVFLYGSIEYAFRK